MTSSSTRLARRSRASGEPTPASNQFFSRSAAYVVFPGVGKGGYVIGGAHGTGVLFEGGGVPAGKVTLNQVTVGAQVGGQEYAEIMFLETPRVVADFKAGRSTCRRRRARSR